MITKQQYRQLMNEQQATGNLSKSAMKAGMSRPTARKYVTAGQPPEELQAKHAWRTRSDPLKEIWSQAEGMLAEAPDLEAKILFEHLRAAAPWAVKEQHLRTFQRRVKLWRLQNGADKEVFFTQDWEPGVALQLDWTHASELGVTIAGGAYEHLLCHAVLPYSNWEWATGICGWTTAARRRTALGRARSGILIRSLRRCARITAWCPKRLGLGVPMRTGMWSRATGI